MSGISQKALQQLRRDLFCHVQQLSLSFFDHRSTGELISRLTRLTNDIDAINQAVSQNVTTLLAGVLNIGISSELGQGTTFKIYLPRHTTTSIET